MDMPELHDQVVDAIVQWALALPPPAGRTRVNRRLKFGDIGIAHAVADVLRSKSHLDCAWVVQGSTDEGAVRLRNDRPDWVSTDAALIYLVFWLPGHDGHERNFESLRDIPTVTLDDFLSRSDEFLFPSELAIREQIHEASKAWADKFQERIREHLLAAWDALRHCLRERGRDRSLRYVAEIAQYLSWVTAAKVPDDEWEQIPVHERAGCLVARWGNALPKLAMFKLPAIASVAGICVNPLLPIPSRSRSGETRWADLFDEILSENKEVATDFPGLEEDIAGKQTLRERLDDLVKKVPLCQDVGAQEAARLALEQFCQSGDAAALEMVEWLYLKDESDRGSASQGLKGLLIARKLKSPQPNPLDRLAGETVALLEELGGREASESGSVRQYVSDLRTRAATNRADALTIAESLRGLAAGVLPQGVSGTPQGPLFLRVLDSPDRRPADLERLARAWEKHGRPDADAPISSDSLLVGLLKLCYARLRGRDAHADLHALRASDEPAGELELSVQVEGRRAAHRNPVDDWSPSRRTALQVWLRDKVRPLFFEGGSDEDEDEEEVSSVTVDVARVVAEKATPFGVIELTIPARTANLLAASRSPTLSSTRIEGKVPTGRILDELFAPAGTVSRAEDPDDDALRQAWGDWLRAGGSDPGWAEIATVAPLPEGARSWVEAWASVLTRAGSGASAQTEISEIQQRLPALANSGQLDEMRRLAVRLGELQSQAAGPAVSVKDARKLLSLCTGIVVSEGRPQQLVLTPHHPLVLRLRLVGEDLLAETLQRLWAVGWDRRTLDDLDGAIDEWGLPEPIHCYGAWDGDPLVFDAWLDEGFARFGPLGAGREVDALGLGAGRVAAELRKYGELLPAAADRLQIRLIADRKGYWAWRVLDEALRDRHFRADVEVVTDLPVRQPLQLDLVTQKEELFGQMLEPGSDGELPWLRVRREDPSRPRGEPVHISAVVGDLIEELRSSITLMAAPNHPASYGIFDRRVFFYEPVPELADYSFSVSDPPDTLSLAVAQAVAFAASHPSQIYCERYSFDPSKCQFRLQQLQQGAHWLVLASRQPLYRAVQQCATSTLLDFYSVVERGRPVHICVGLDAHRAGESADRLGRLVEALLDAPVSPEEARGMLDAARALAPGLAIRCIGSTGSIELSGLLGLLLSTRATADESSESLLLSLDQHRDLLSGSGQLSDLILIALADGQIRIGVVEAKFSTGLLSVESARIHEAARQVQSTVQRLAQFTLDHPLVLRTRTRLARTIVHRIHLGAPAPDQVLTWSTLLDAVLDPGVPIRIETAPTSVHAWSVSNDTKNGVHQLQSGERIQIHGRSETIAMLKRLQ